MSYSFNGTDQYIQDSSVSPVAGTPCTLACWFRPTNNTGGNLLQICSSSGNDSHRISMTSSGTYRIGSTEAGTNGNADGSTIISINTWHHLCGVFTSSASRTGYLNGSDISTNTASRNPTSFTRTVIGARRDASVFGIYFTGQIAEAAIWDVALTVDEILSLSSGVTSSLVRPQNLAFHAPLVRTIFDYRTNKLNLTNNGTATVSDLHPRIYL